MKVRGSLQDRGRTSHLRSEASTQAAARSTADSPRAIRVLSISDYDGLCVSRELLLAQAGFGVESHTSSTCFDVLAARRFQIAILCHSIASERAIRIAEVLRRHQPHIWVLRLSPSEHDGSPFFDCELDRFTPPEEFLRVLREETNRLSA